jgi:hypothetical protein
MMQPGLTVPHRSLLPVAAAGGRAALRCSGAWRAGGDGEERPDDDSGIALKEASPELKRPPLFKVILLNDDYTPMEFVVEVLEIFFQA